MHLRFARRGIEHDVVDDASQRDPHLVEQSLHQLPHVIVGEQRHQFPFVLRAGRLIDRGLKFGAFSFGHHDLQVIEFR